MRSDPVVVNSTQILSLELAFSSAIFDLTVSHKLSVTHLLNTALQLRSLFASKAA